MANTSVSSNLGYVAWESEDNEIAEASDDTYTTGITLRDDQVDLSGLVQGMVDPGGVYQRLNERDLYRLDAFNLGTFTITMDLYGHGSTAAGALTETNLAKLLAHAVGNSDWTPNGGVADGVGDADTLTTDGGSELFLNGGLVRAGALGDGRGGGQAYACSTVTGTPATSTELLTGLPVAANDSDVVYAMGMVYPVSATGSGDILTSDGSTSNNTLRFVLMSGNLQYVARGCACTSINITGLNPGEIPQIEMEWSTVAWAPVSQTFPSATALDDKTPVPCAAGSVFLNTVGTTTWASVAPLEIGLSIGQGMQSRPGTGTTNVGQNMAGWHRVPAETTLTLTVEAEAVTASPSHWLTANPTAARHAVINCNTTDGASVALYFPRLIQMNNPTQGSTNGLNTRTFEYRCATGATTTSELTLSAWRLGLA